MRRLAPLSILALTSVASAQANGGAQALSWLDQQILKRIQVTGYRQLGFHAHTVDGDRDAFNSLTYYGQGGRQFTDTGSVNLRGSKVLGLFDFDVTLTDNRYQDPQAQRLTLNYDKGPVQIQAGDVQASLLNTNQFVAFSRNVKGATVMYRNKGFSAKILRTETKGSARTISFQGTNSSGPYYLQNSQLVNGSEAILLDGQPLTLGVDYVIDYEIGMITFINRMVPPTSTITVSYEAFDFNAAKGTITGAGVSYDFGKAGRIGLTAMSQDSRGNGGLSSRIEQFEGFGAPSTPYFLQFEPMNSAAYPTKIRVDGILQIQGVDYHFDTKNKSVFYFHRFIPASSIIEVAYFPKPTSLAEGDRRVIGLDYTIPIGKRGSISYAQATGKLSSDVNPLVGTARGISTRYESGGFKIRAGLTDIPEDFVSVETRGFNRNERASDISLSYAKKGINYDLSYKNASVSSRTIDGFGNAGFNRARETIGRIGVSHNALKPTELSWNLDHTRLGVKRFGVQTDLDTTSAFASHASGRATSRYGLQNQMGRLLSYKDGNQNISLQTLRYDLDYRAGKGWTVAGRAGITRSKFDEESGTGHDLSLNGVYRPNSKFSLDVGYTDSKSGQVSTLSGLTGAYGSGYDGNGFSSGLVSGSPIVGGTDLRLLQAHAAWQPFERLSLDLRAYNARTQGSFSANSETLGLGLGMDLDLGRGHNFSFSIDRTNTRYIENAFSSSATTLDASIGGRIANRWTYRFGSGLLVTDGGQYSQNSYYGSGALTYKLSRRENLSARFNVGRTTGYYPQDDMYAGLFYEYQLYRNVSLIGSYKWRKVANLDPLFTSGAYRSRGFDLEISFNFGG